MKSLFIQIKDLFFCKIGWHDWNDDRQCEHCKTWHCVECEKAWLGMIAPVDSYLNATPSDDRCIHGEFKARCPICRKR